MSEFVVLFVVELLEDPDAYSLVVVEVYPPSIAVLLPEVFVWVEPAKASVGRSKSSNVVRRVFIVVISCVLQNSKIVYIFYEH